MLILNVQGGLKLSLRLLQLGGVQLIDALHNLADNEFVCFRVHSIAGVGRLVLPT